MPNRVRLSHTHPPQIDVARRALCLNLVGPQGILNHLLPLPAKISKHNRLVLYIVAANPAFKHYGRVIAFTLMTSDGRLVANHHAFIGPMETASSSGAILAFLRMDILPRIAAGSLLHIVTKEKLIADAFTEGWIARWKQKGFKNPDWRLLSEDLDKKGLTPTSERPGPQSADRFLLDRLVVWAQWIMRADTDEKE